MLAVEGLKPLGPQRYQFIELLQLPCVSLNVVCTWGCKGWAALT